MSDIFNYAVSQVNRSRRAFCRFITANDVNMTSHQAGFYVPKEAESLLFDVPGERGSNKDRFVKIRWQDDFETASRFIYYGVGSRNEYRITRFGKGFPFLNEEYVGSLLIICQVDRDDYVGIVLEHDEDIDDFYTEYNLSVGKTNHFIDSAAIISPDERLGKRLVEIAGAMTDFPDTGEISGVASQIYNEVFGITENKLLDEPDKILCGWIKTESELFYQFEDIFYRPMYSTPFSSIRDFAAAANSFLNRRKSRFGKSLEHHLAHIFTESKLRFEEQVVTEDKKRPDFLFPGGKEYHDFLFPADDLTFLGAKTTCKDRWRQVLNEADRIGTKYLFTLQPSISANQLQEMKHERVVLVIPEDNRNSFDDRYRSDLLSLKQFISIVKEKQNRHFA
mgnify:FL=1